MSDDDKISVYFKWLTLSPDRRQWKPSLPVLEPAEVVVVVDVPKEFVKSNQSKTILTLEGLRYCVDQFESVMSDKEEPDTFEKPKNGTPRNVNAEEEDEWS